MTSDYQSIWEQAHKRNYAYLPFKIDPNNPNLFPQRATPVSINTGIQMEVMTSDQEIHDTSGMQQASLGQRSNEKSGRAIFARQREAGVAHFVFYDNLAQALKYQGKVLVEPIT